MGAFIGAMVWGMGRGGGQLAWKIGVLAFCNQKQAPAYLGIHTFLTGVRGIISPFIGAIALNNGVDPQLFFLIASGFIFLSAVGTWVFVKPTMAYAMD